MLPSGKYSVSWRRAVVAEVNIARRDRYADVTPETNFPTPSQL